MLNATKSSNFCPLLAYCHTPTPLSAEALAETDELAGVSAEVIDGVVIIAAHNNTAQICFFQVFTNFPVSHRSHWSTDEGTCSCPSTMRRVGKFVFDLPTLFGTRSSAWARKPLAHPTGNVTTPNA